MKFFIDTANVDEIKQAKSWGILDGVTTNPSLIAKEGVDHKTRVMEIIDIVGDVPVSAECVETEVDKLMKEAQGIASWAPNIFVKVPMTQNAMEVVKELSPRGINFNVTLIFSLPQALIAAKAGGSFISFFVGRIDDMGSLEAPENIIEAVNMVETYDFPKEPQILVASIRSPLQVTESIKAGAHILIPFKTMEMLFKHPLTDIGIKRFFEDYSKATGGKNGTSKQDSGQSIEDKAKVG